MIRRCAEGDFETIYAIVNDAAQAYKGVIPADRWHEPYMPRDELRHELAQGVAFWGYEEPGQLVGVISFFPAPEGFHAGPRMRLLSQTRPPGRVYNAGMSCRPMAEPSAMGKPLPRAPPDRSRAPAVRGATEMKEMIVSGCVSAHRGVCELHSAMQTAGVSDVFQRYQLQQPQCAFGRLGICCQLCSHGPCRITRRTDRGICGADANTIAARNLLRLATHGTGAYSHHLRTTLKTLRNAAGGGFPGLRDLGKLQAVAGSLGLGAEGRPSETAATQLADLFDRELVRPADEESGIVAHWAPESRQRVWRALGIFPGGPHSELADALAKSMTSIDTDPADLLLTAMRLAIATGYVEMMGIEALQDVLFGHPRIAKTRTGIGVLDPAYVNIVAHGHEPFMAEAVMDVAQEGELVALARAAGAQGIKLYGSMDTGQELLQRKADHPVFAGQIGNWLTQEFMVYTGAVDLVMMDMNCSIPGLKMAADARHTRLLPVSKIVRMAGVAEAVDYAPDAAHQQARQIVRMAIEQYRRRDPRLVQVPNDQQEAMVGFGIESIVEALGGTLEPLLDAVKQGSIKGIAAVVGCTNNANGHDHISIALTRELIKRDILVINSGCVSSGVQNQGLMQPAAAGQAGAGLQAVCRALGVPPALNFGTCTDIGRIVQAVNAIAGALGVDPAQLPVAASAPEYLEQKAVVDGFFGVASGLLVHLAPMPPVGGAAEVVALLTSDVEKLTGGKILVELDPRRAAEEIERHMLQKREALGI